MSFDFNAINNELVKQFETKLGAAPGKFREENRKEYLALRDTPDKVYDERGATIAEASRAFNNLSFRMRRLGYSAETIGYAVVSLASDPSNIPQVINNLSFRAYAIGMMDGDYKGGWGAYNELDAYMKNRNAFDTTAQIKSLQNKGQILHRMGIQDPANYKRASACYDEVFALLERSELDNKTKAQFDSQARFCRSKMSLHRAHIEPENADALIKQAYSDITIATFAANVPGFEFEYGCMKVVQGSIEVSIGAKAEGYKNIAEGLALQKQYGPTLTPRHVSSESKLEMAEYGQISKASLEQKSKRLSDFYGRKAAPHPDMAFIVQNAERSAKPISGLRL